MSAARSSYGSANFDRCRPRANQRPAIELHSADRRRLQLAAAAQRTQQHHRLWRASSAATGSGTTSSFGVEANYIYMTESRSISQIRFGVRYNPDLIDPQPDTISTRGREALRLRLAAHPRPASWSWRCFLPYAVCRHAASAGRTTVDREPVSALSAISRCCRHIATDRQQDQAGLWLQRSALGVDVMLVGGLFMRAEYEYRRVTSDIETNINTVRAGLGYKF